MNYDSKGRSNYFAVNDARSFENDLNSYDIGFVVKDGHYAVICGDGWEAYDSDEDKSYDPEVLIGPHLADGEVCVYQEVGSEGMRYLSGYSVAFSNAGVLNRVDLRDIYRGLPEGTTEAQY